MPWKQICSTEDIKNVIKLLPPGCKDFKMNCSLTATSTLIERGAGITGTHKGDLRPWNTRTYLYTSLLSTQQNKL
ncbi:Uncharacterized protein FWK35_00024751 [Aphis craccivora]|uniref:Uncharacterized protein n=1 Tax=Aphis craccivora TaxID=307492 RepID=A0A6G0YCJ8_APHCR|nr:Uncharacterized protein FWK35_00024751 [Aphis craccivora]